MKSDWHPVERTAAAATALANASTPSQVETPARRRVLVADRDGEARAGLANVLESLGYEVIATGDIDEALEIARHQLPDAALFDIGAPHLEGLDAARRMRELAAKRPLFLIALTGWGQPQYREMAMEAGFDVHLVKPVGPDQLSFLLSMTLV